MTTRINLAPEVYQQAQNAKRLKQVATSATIVAVGVSVGVIVTLLVIIGGQKVGLAVLQGQINDDQKQLKQYTNLQDAVTVQQHLDSLSKLQSQRVYLSNLFNVMQNVDPTSVTLSNLAIDSKYTLEISASGKTYAMATKFAKALEAYNVKIGPGAAASNQPFFTNVSLAGVSDDGAGSVSYKISTQMAGGVTSGK